MALRAVRAGALDFVEQPFDPEPAARCRPSRDRRRRTPTGNVLARPGRAPALAAAELQDPKPRQAGGPCRWSRTPCTRPTTPTRAGEHPVGRRQKERISAYARNCGRPMSTSRTPRLWGVGLVTDRELEGTALLGVDQDLEKGEGRRHHLPPSGGDVLEERRDDRQEALVLLDVVDTGAVSGAVGPRRVPDRASPLRGARRGTWRRPRARGRCGPGPAVRGSTRGSGPPTACSRITVTSWATDCPGAPGHASGACDPGRRAGSSRSASPPLVLQAAAPFEDPVRQQPSAATRLRGRSQLPGRAEGREAQASVTGLPSAPRRPAEQAAVDEADDGSR